MKSMSKQGFFFYHRHIIIIILYISCWLLLIRSGRIAPNHNHHQRHQQQMLTKVCSMLCYYILLLLLLLLLAIMWYSIVQFRLWEMLIKLYCYTTRRWNTWGWEMDETMIRKHITYMWRTKRSWKRKNNGRIKQKIKERAEKFKWM